MEHKIVRVVRLRKLSHKLFRPVGKNPYMFRGKAIHDLEELYKSLGDFTSAEAAWLASWLDYLGDPETATNIRKSPENFKNIVSSRHDELVRYL